MALQQDKKMDYYTFDHHTLEEKEIGLSEINRDIANKENKQALTQLKNKLENV